MTTIGVRFSALLLFVAMLMLSGCGKRGYEAPQGGAVVPLSKVRLKRNVDIVPVRQDRMSSYVETVGFLEAEGQTDIAAGVSGTVVEVLFREGQPVEKGKTVLARIEPKKYQALLAQAEANLEKAKANVDRIEALKKRNEAAILDATQAMALRQVMLENIRRAGRSVKAEEKQEAEANYEMMAARLSVAKADKSVTDADLTAAQKEVEAMQAMVTIARRNLELSEVRAPYTGQINQRRVTEGMYVEDKTTIATMADLSRLRLVGYIPERVAPIVRQMVDEAVAVRPAFLTGSCLATPWVALAAHAIDLQGATPPFVEFEVRPFPQRKFYGRIFYLSTVANSDTHLFECKADVPTHGMGAELRPGFTAKIRCPLPRRGESLIVPEVAVRASERGFIAFRPRTVTSKDGKLEYVAEAVPLELGQREPGWVEVLKGLQPGDVVVSKGAEALEDGTPLAIPEDKLSLIHNGRN